MTFTDEVQAEPLRVVAAVIIRDGCVLACRRNAARSAGGLWEFPGGKVELGESPEHALRREIREELDAEIEVGELIHRATTPTDTAHIDLSSYEALLTDAAPTRSTDHDVLRWLRPNQLSELEWARPDLPVVELLGQRGRWSSSEARAYRDQETS
ncbi:MAG TPA: (deoxy)nucleoside triphosphate pyrophosphohydrolase [Microbacteriaceae bacterium]